MNVALVVVALVVLFVVGDAIRVEFVCRRNRRELEADEQYLEELRRRRRNVDRGLN